MLRVVIPLRGSQEQGISPKIENQSLIHEQSFLNTYYEPCAQLAYSFQFSTLSRLFKDVMEEYNKEQEAYRDKNKDRIMKQLHYGKLLNRVWVVPPLPI